MKSYFYFWPFWYRILVVLPDWSSLHRLRTPAKMLRIAGKRLSFLSSSCRRSTLLPTTSCLSPDPLHSPAAGAGVGADSNPILAPPPFIFPNRGLVSFLHFFESLLRVSTSKMVAFGCLWLCDGNCRLWWSFQWIKWLALWMNCCVSFYDDPMLCVISWM